MSQNPSASHFVSHFYSAHSVILVAVDTNRICYLLTYLLT